MDLVQVFYRDYVAQSFFDVIVSREEALFMSLASLRKQVRAAREVFAAAKAVGDKAAQDAAHISLESRVAELQVAVLKENGLGVSKADESAGKSKVFPPR